MEAPQGPYHAVVQEPIHVAGTGARADGVIGLDAGAYRVLLGVARDRVVDPVGRNVAEHLAELGEAPPQAIGAPALLLASPVDEEATQAPAPWATPLDPSGAPIGGDGLAAQEERRVREVAGPTRALGEREEVGAARHRELILPAT